MVMKDTPRGYSLLTIVLHWLVAAGLIALFTLAFLAEEAATEERAGEFILRHVSVAVTLYVVFWARIIWRFVNVRPELPPQSAPLQFLAYWVPLIMVIALAAQLITGPLTVISAGYPIQVFGVTVVPQLMEKSESLHEVAETVHEIGAQVIFWGFVLHVLGTFKHLLINRDGSFKRILVPTNKE